jgi:4'-phosphopantetheinyl transferase
MPRLDREVVDVWIASVDLDEVAVREITSCLSDDERARAERFRFERDRRRFGVARAMLRRILSAYLPSVGPGDLRLGYGSCGKPHLVGGAGEADLRFNLAHSGGLVAIAVTRGGAVGIDLEEIRPGIVDDRLAAAALSEADLGAFRRARSNDREFVFFSIWTRTEALLKATGVGLSGGGEDARDDDGPDEWRIWPLRPAPGFVGAVAAGPEKTSVRLCARPGAPGGEGSRGWYHAYAYAGATLLDR